MILALELISVVTRCLQVLTIAPPLFFAEITTTEGAHCLQLRPRIEGPGTAFYPVALRVD
jgi:hypothetical protein